MTRTRSQSGALAREKGERFMRECVKRLQAAGIGCEKRSQYRGARKDGCDIEDTDWWIECTHGKGADPRVKYAQALRDQDDAADREPVFYHHRPIVVLWKRDGMRGIVATLQLCALIDAVKEDALGNHADGILVTMSIEDWIRIAKEAP